jgi:alpha-L-fucosidase 2
MNRLNKIIKVLCLVSLVTFSVSAIENKNTENPSLKLWYTSPAQYFINALPLGNGRLAAMVYGRTAEETINLNEETLWSGGPVNENPNPNASTYLEPVRKALDDHNYRLADKLSHNMQGYFSQSYAPVGDLIIKQKYDGEVTNYYRDLDIEKAISTTRFQANGTTFTREYFVSAPAQVVVVKFTSSKPKSLNLNISTKTLLKAEIGIEGKELVTSGRAPSHADPTYLSTSDKPIQWGDECKGMRFQSRIKTLNNDGKEAYTKNEIIISDATNVTLIVSIATSYNGFDKCPVSNGKDEVALAKGYLTRLGITTYNNLKLNHIADYSKYFKKVNFFLKGNNDAEKLPTDERLASYKTNKSDNQLETLLYQYGRYLLISSSRPGGIAANLQGKWNVDLRPAWSCNYTTNINLEMNYWAAEKTGLGDMHQPMIQQVVNMSKTGKDIAKNMYKLPGWVAGHNSDIWALTNPVGHIGLGDPQWANWIMGAPWVSQHLWEKYAYNGDKIYLKNTAYPVMKGAAEFCLAWMIDDGNGHLLTSPSTSPENRFVGEDGKSWAVVKGATMDLGLIRNLLENTIEASQILNVDNDFRNKMSIALTKMLPYQIGKAGNLQEWSVDYKELDTQHRHVSHLFCLHPGNDISANKTPELFNACKQTLITRGDGGTGWSRAWKIAFWARLLDGNHAYKLIQSDLELCNDRGFSETGGTYPNLLNACPPYQIDGNFGVVEGISEMLMQSHLKEIHLLPALPDAWATGSISGLKARGGFDLIKMSWANGKLTDALLMSKNAGVCKLRTQKPIQIQGVKLKTIQEISPAGKTYLNTFAVKAGGKYQIVSI